VTRSPDGAAATQVRIIGGQWRRSRVPVPRGDGVRPTPDRVRETLFNWLGQSLEGWRCLDLYAGSGVLGLEAASRGAVRVVSVERDRRVAEALRGTATRLGAEQVTVVCAEARAWLGGSAERFDLVFVDPPYAGGELRRVLPEAARHVSPGGWLYAESDAPVIPGGPGFESLAGWTVHRAACAGRVHYHLLRPPPAEPGA
jgi:16S rRNA (guanine966-N2)-methyltransferase